MQRLNRQELSQLLDSHDAASGPCVSIYVPFGREQKRYPVCRIAERVKHLLESHYPGTTRAFLEKLEAFTESRRTPGRGGIALFKSAKVEGYLPLVETTAELVVVAESFHVRPLLGYFQAQDGARDALKSYDAAKTQGLGIDTLPVISHAAANGRIKTLFLEKGVHLWGHVCRSSGALRLATASQQDSVDDILDDLAEMTLAAKGEVYVLPTAEMPTSAALCAILRPNA